MGVIGIILLVAFVIICLLVIGVVLLQNEEGGGLGGLFGGSGSQAFGSRSGTVLTTYVLVALFFIATFVLAFINRAPTVRSLDGAAEQSATTTTGGAWYEDTATEEPAPAELSSDTSVNE